jgi:hypothetical protein
LQKGVSGCFPPRRPASTAPRPISACELSLPPITTPPTLTTETHMSGFLPPNPPWPCARWHCCRDSHRCAIHPLPPPRHSIARQCDCLLEPSRCVPSHAVVGSLHAVCHRCARDAVAKLPATRPYVAVLLPSPLLAPRVGFV